VAILTENETSFFLSTPAVIVNDEIDVASEWAGKHIVSNKAIKWILAKYVEADNANNNGQFWTLSDLQAKQTTIKHSPMNIGHRGQDIVGTWTAAEMMYPIDADSAVHQNPYIETLGAFWRYYFPEMLAQVEAAYDTGSLFVSMECRGDSITCGGPNGCGETFTYKGPMDESYCEHVLNRESYRQINNPHFLAGALILPPDRPGWSNAAVKELSALTSDSQKEEMLHSIASEVPHLDHSEWEKIMFNLQAHALAETAIEDAKTPASLIGLRVANQFMSKAYQ
jgi:hypothetical protein